MPSATCTAEPLPVSEKGKTENARSMKLELSQSYKKWLVKWSCLPKELPTNLKLEHAGSGDKKE
jgi:hypothetical protein